MVAVVGASDDPSKWGNLYAKTVLKGEHRRTVLLVNGRGTQVLGRNTYTSLLEVPVSPDLVVCVTPAGALEQVIDDGLAMGARSFVVITAGLGEEGPAGVAREQAIVGRIRGAGAVMVGPNCLGIVDTNSDLDAGGFIDLPRGNVAFFSQSGTLGCDLSLRGRAAGYGFSRFVSLGNQADLTVSELIDDAVTHEATRAIALYCEDVISGRHFVHAAARATNAGKPVVLLWAGGSEAGSRSASSHTGALAADSALIDAACRSAGIFRADSPGEMSDLLFALTRGKRSNGHRTAIVSEGGGSCTIAADLASATGLEVVPFSSELAAALVGVVRAGVRIDNPLDLGGDERPALAASTKLLAEDDGVDAVLVAGLLGWYSGDGDVDGAPQDAPESAQLEVDAAHAIAGVARQTSKPIVVSTVIPKSAAGRILTSAGVFVHREYEPPLRLLSRLADAAVGQGGLSALPAPNPPIEVTGSGYWDARELVASAGITMTAAVRVSTAEDAVEAANRIGYPVVLKNVALLHKSDRGGVKVGIDGDDALVATFREMWRIFGASDYSVEAMEPLERGVEVIIGCKQDNRFGPVVLVGIGGAFVELFQDVVLEIGPIDADRAASMFDRLRARDILRGARGRRPVDIGAAAEATAALSRISAAHPDLAELEINPLLLLPERAVGLDARLVQISNLQSREPELP
ncbi:MAG: acetate--CoA ligase family protein [Actinomycetota bacterium]|nr:acetate--CoA ligase family protein [Actinomycetota bacterium]